MCLSGGTYGKAKVWFCADRNHLNWGWRMCAHTGVTSRGWGSCFYTGVPREGVSIRGYHLQSEGLSLHRGTTCTGCLSLYGGYRPPYTEALSLPRGSTYSKGGLYLQTGAPTQDSRSMCWGAATPGRGALRPHRGAPWAGGCP